MVDISIKNKLSQLNGPLNFDGLIKFIELTGFDFKDRDLINAIGIATTDCIYLDIGKLRHYIDDFIFFVILHEICHFKRIAKIGKLETIRLLSLDDFNLFHEHILNEEILADRYACSLFYRFNKKIYPYEMTQQLDQPKKKKEYKNIAKRYFGFIQNDEQRYDELIKSFIKN